MKWLILALGLTTTSYAQTLSIRLVDSGIEHHIDVKSDTISYLVGGNVYLKTGSQPGYDLGQYTDYTAGTIHYDDTVGVFNFWSQDALFSLRPYSEVKILRLDNNYKRFVTLISGSVVEFDEEKIRFINPFVFSSEHGNFTAFEQHVFEYNTTGIHDSKIQNQPVKYFDMTGREVRPVSGLYIKQSGYNRKLVYYDIRN
jgi:hypothetical protein